MNCEGGSELEHRLRDSCIELAAKLSANIEFPYSSATNNSQFPNLEETMNYYINRSRIGILTTRVEGINRFKMECLAAGVPVLVPEDTSYSTKKDINQETGEFFKPTPEVLARAIKNILENFNRYNPRSYTERTTGKQISLIKLKNALWQLCKQDCVAYRFDDEVRIKSKSKNPLIRFFYHLLGMLLIIF